MWYGQNGGPEFRVLFYKRRIYLEISHLITDGTVAVEFLKAILAEYLRLSDSTFKIPGTIKSVTDMPAPEETENAYGRYYSGEKPSDEPKTASAYQLTLGHKDGYVKAVFGLIDIESLKARSRERGMTVTEHLTASEILAVIQSAPEAITEPVKVSVPVNLRSFFRRKPCATLRPTFPSALNRAAERTFRLTKSVRRFRRIETKNHKRIHAKLYQQNLFADTVKIRVKSSDADGFDEAGKGSGGKCCDKCGVELPEEYTVCPLCGEKAAESKVPPVIVQSTAEYPHPFPVSIEESGPSESGRPSLEKANAFLHL